MPNRLPKTQLELTPFLRRLLFDAADDGCHACELMGLFPMADDQADREHEESAGRIRKVEDLIPIVASMSEWLARHAVEEYLEGEEFIDPPEYVRLQMHYLYRHLILSSTVSIISTLVDAGKLDLAA